MIVFPKSLLIDGLHPEFTSLPEFVIQWVDQGLLTDGLDPSNARVTGFTCTWFIVCLPKEYLLCTYYLAVYDGFPYRWFILGLSRGFRASTPLWVYKEVVSAGFHLNSFNRTFLR